MIAIRTMRALIPLCALLGLGAAGFARPAAAQSIRVTAESENFRAEPRGEIVAALPRGTPLEDATREGEWYRATLRGWIWEPSVESAGRAARLRVIAVGGENLRATPNGAALGRVNPQAVLTELERRDRWVHVERTAWIWAASVEAAGTGPVGRPVQPPAPEAPRPRPAAPSASRPVPAQSGSWLRAGSGGVALLQSPDGDTLARVRPMTAMEVVAREGNWARVRVDGWVWQPGLGSAADSAAVLRDVSAAVLAANPENFRGRTVEWRLQFISLERAERIRTDFYEGEPFILARGPNDENAFVYVAVPPERVSQVERLGPLERITVLGRVRTGRSRVMGAPVLDLLELRRE